MGGRLSVCEGLFKLEEAIKSRHGEDLFEVVVHSRDEEVYAFGLGGFEQSEEESQSA